MNLTSLSPRIQIVLFNLIPLIGVAFFNWSPFALFYAFWLETLSITFLNTLAILFAQGEGWSLKNISLSLTFFIIQSGILFFYLLFIIVFIGLQMDYGTGPLHFVEVLILKEPMFRWTVLIFFAIKLIEMAYSYFFNKSYLVSVPSDFYYFFSPRTIVIHIVIVIGFFSYTFLKDQINNHAGLVIFTVVFVGTKILFELLLKGHRLTENKGSATYKP